MKTGYEKKSSGMTVFTFPVLLDPTFHSLFDALCAK